MIENIHAHRFQAEDQLAKGPALVVGVAAPGAGLGMVVRTGQPGEIGAVSQPGAAPGHNLAQHFKELPVGRFVEGAVLPDFVGIEGVEGVEQLHCVVISQHRQLGRRRSLLQRQIRLGGQLLGQSFGVGDGGQGFGIAAQQQREAAGRHGIHGIPLAPDTRQVWEQVLSGNSLGDVRQYPFFHQVIHRHVVQNQYIRPRPSQQLGVELGEGVLPAAHQGVLHIVHIFFQGVGVLHRDAGRLLQSVGRGLHRGIFIQAEHRHSTAGWGGQVGVPAVAVEGAAAVGHIAAGHLDIEGIVFCHSRLLHRQAWSGEAIPAAVQHCFGGGTAQDVVLDLAIVVVHIVALGIARQQPAGRVPVGQGQLGRFLPCVPGAEDGGRVDSEKNVPADSHALGGIVKGQSHLARGRGFQLAGFAVLHRKIEGLPLPVGIVPHHRHLPVEFSLFGEPGLGQGEITVSHLGSQIGKAAVGLFLPLAVGAHGIPVGCLVEDGASRIFHRESVEGIPHRKKAHIVVVVGGNVLLHVAPCRLGNRGNAALALGSAGAAGQTGRCKQRGKSPGQHPQISFHLDSPFGFLCRYCTAACSKEPLKGLEIV